ncbi:MAG TPA: hypothetical protein VGO59_08800 [Verrucomicrobiae bacterium]
MKTYKLLLALALGAAGGLAAQAQEQTNEYLMNWNAVGYTHNARGVLVATNVNQQTLVNIVATNNGLNPRDLEFVYRVEKRDTAVVWKTNGVFVADVYQMEYNYLDVTNQTGTIDYLETLLNDEYHTNAIGSTFGIQETIHNKAGYLTGYSYHGTFHSYFPENGVVFTGSFSTGARVYLKDGEGQ